MPKLTGRSAIMVWRVAKTYERLSEAFYADAVRRVNLLTLAFALYFPTFERLRSTRSLA